MTVRALIADDERHVAQDLQNRLKGLWPDLDIVAVARDGIEAARLIHALEPDIVFLDIKMPGATGLEVAQRIAHPCLLVFVTAYDRFAVDAFERAAADYLVKPVSDERLAKAVLRLKEAVRDRRTPDVSALIAALARAGEHSARLKWIKASIGNRFQLVPVEEVCYFQATDKYTSVWTRNEQLLIRTPIKELARQLDPQQFWRIHRSTIVNVKQIDTVTSDAQGHLTLKLRDRAETLAVSRSCNHLFRQM